MQQISGELTTAGEETVGKVIVDGPENVVLVLLQVLEMCQCDWSLKFSSTYFSDVFVFASQSSIPFFPVQDGMTPKKLCGKMLDPTSTC